MVIAVNTRFLLKDQLEGIGYFTQEVLSRLTAQHPEHQFYFLFDRRYSDEFLFSENVSPLVLSPPARHPLLWKYWFDVKLFLALKRIGADVFLSLDGFCSLTTKIPQCLLVHDLGFLHCPDAYKKTHLLFYRYYTPKFIQKAKRVVTVSQFSKNDIIQHYKTDAAKIDVVYNAVKDIFQPVPFAIKAAIKERYTEGKEYFICVGALQPRKNLINLLKAFAQFKKRQQTNCKLVLAGRPAWKNDAFLKLLKTYKYRDDVVVTGYVKEEELARLIGSAYALVYPSFFEGFGVPMLEAMKCHVPCLTSTNTSMQEIGEEAALYFEPTNSADIAEKLMMIYKDETLRSQLIEKGKAVAVKYSWQQTADLLWQSILQISD